MQTIQFITLILELYSFIKQLFSEPVLGSGYTIKNRTDKILLFMDLTFLSRLRENKWDKVVQIIINDREFKNIFFKVQVWELSDILKGDQEDLIDQAAFQ